MLVERTGHQLQQSQSKLKSYYTNDICFNNDIYLSCTSMDRPSGRTRSFIVDHTIIGDRFALLCYRYSILVTSRFCTAFPGLFVFFVFPICPNTALRPFPKVLRDFDSLKPSSCCTRGGCRSFTNNR